MCPAHCSWRGDTSFSLSRTACSGSRMPTLPWPQMPKRYGTFCLIRYSAISSPPFIFAMVLSQGKSHDAFLGHLVDSIARAFAPEAAVLRSAIRHQVHARARGLVHVHPADFQPARRRERVVEAIGEEAGGEAVGRGVHARDRLVEGIEGHDAYHGSENLLAADLHRIVDRSEQGRRHDGALARAAGHAPRAP